jgi:hypothetical protein
VGKVGCGFCPGFVFSFFFFFSFLRTSVKFVFCLCVCFLSLVRLSSFLVCVYQAFFCVCLWEEWGSFRTFSLLLWERNFIWGFLIS